MPTYVYIYIKQSTHSSMMPLTPNLFAVWITGIGGALVRELQARWRGEGALLLSLQSNLQINHISASFFLYVL